MPLHPSFSHREYVSDLALWCSPGNLPVSVLPHTHTKLLQLAYCCCFKTAGTRRWHSTSILTARLNGIALPPTPAQAMTAAMAATMVWARSSTYMLRDEFALPRDFPQLVSVIVFSFFPFVSPHVRCSHFSSTFLKWRLPLGPRPFCLLTSLLRRRH